MDRRGFLGLLGASAAAIALPERTRSYFFGGWPNVSQREADAVAFVQQQPWWSDEAQLRNLLEQVQNRIISLESAQDLAFADLAPSSGFIPEVWSEQVMQAVQIPNYFDVNPLLILPEWRRGKLVSVRKLSSLEKGPHSD